MDEPIDWKQVFIAYMDHVFSREGTDYLWSRALDGVDGFISRLPKAARDEVRELVKAHREARSRTPTAQAARR